MKYKLIDCQGGGLMADDIFKTRAEARDRLRGFHSIDVPGANKMSLNSLLEIGCWELEVIK